MVQKSDNDASRMTRRTLIIAGGAVVAAIALKLRKGIETVEAKGNVPKEVKVVQFSDAGNGRILSPYPSSSRRMRSGNSSYRLIRSK